MTIHHDKLLPYSLPLPSLFQEKSKWEWGKGRREPLQHTSSTVYSKLYPRVEAPGREPPRVTPAAWPQEMLSLGALSSSHLGTPSYVFLKCCIWHLHWEERKEMLLKQRRGRLSPCNFWQQQQLSSCQHSYRLSSL